MKVITQKVGFSLNNPTSSTLEIATKVRLTGPEYQRLLLEAKTLRMKNGMPIKSNVYDRWGGGERIFIAKGAMKTSNK